MISDKAPVSTLALTATFTAEALREPLAFWMKELGWSYEIQFAGYNQVFQELLDPRSLLRANRGGVNIVLIRLEDWVRFGDSALPDLAEIERNAGELTGAIRSTASCLSSPLILCLCPASPQFLSDPARAAFHERMARSLTQSVAGLSGVHLIPPAELDALYAVADVHDPHADELGHVPYTPLYFAALATTIVRKIHALRMTPYKVIVLDCDETLWKGICGEDGPQGVTLDTGRRALQEFMLRQHDAGKLLCLVSKNNQADVLDTFRLNPEMPLRLDHFVAWRINWQPKSENVADLAQELELGLDSFILVDDNPKECSEMEANRPEVLALALPADPDRIGPFLAHVWAFDHLRITEEDRRRTALYAQQLERGRAEKQAATLEEFLQSLQLEIRIAPMAPADLPRVAQLTQRTNQMNVTAVRRSEIEIQALAESGEAEVLTVQVSDRFGSYGLTGVMIYRIYPNSLTVDTFLLSCRVLGRGVEHRMLAALGKAAVQKKLPVVEVPFLTAARNLPARLFLESVGLEYQQAEPDRLWFRFPAEKAAGTVHKPTGAPTPAAAAPKHERKAAVSNIPYARIARELRDPQQILQQLQSQAQVRGQASSNYVPPRTELEQRLTEIWIEALHVSPIGIQDDFFDLGGHSLLAVQLMSQVRQEFGVDLSLELVYSGAFNIAELAEAIEVKEIEKNGGDRYAALIEELEALTDEEVRELLAKEGDRSCESS